MHSQSVLWLGQIVEIVITLVAKQAFMWEEETMRPLVGSLLQNKNEQYEV